MRVYIIAEALCMPEESEIFSLREISPSCLSLNKHHAKRKQDLTTTQRTLFSAAQVFAGLERDNELMPRASELLFRVTGCRHAP